MQPTPVKGKIYGPEPQILQTIADRIQNEFTPDCTISRPIPSKDGGYHLLFTIYREAPI